MPGLHLLRDRWPASRGAPPPRSHPAPSWRSRVAPSPRPRRAPSDDAPAPDTRPPHPADHTPPLGASDCERIRTGVLAQPANTLSAATLAACGVWIARRHRHHRHAGLVGTVVAAAGAGSAAYHGPGGRVSGWAHDVTITAMLGVIALEDVREVRPDLGAGATLTYAAAMAGVGVLLAVRPWTIRHVTAVLAGAAVVAELSARRIARGETQRAHRLAEALMAGAVVAYVAGRTGSRACRPDSLIQLHGLWHSLSGAAMAAWADACLGEA